MGISYYYEQEKVEKNKPLKSECKLKLVSDDDFVMMTAEYYIEYLRLGKMNFLTYDHGLTINKKTGDFTVIYRLKNKKDNSYHLYKNLSKVKKNNFEMLLDFTQRGFYAGEKRHNFWGVKHRKALTDIFKLLFKELDFVRDEVTHKKDGAINPLYDMLVDCHLEKKGIKGHDLVYWHICEVYPKRKYLKLNDNKFLAAVLDQYGIKSRYLIGSLSNNDGGSIAHLKSLRFLCSLFGESYVDYIKQFDWKNIVFEYIKTNKVFVCESDAEKKVLVQCLKKYSEIDAYIHDGILNTIYDLFVLKKFLKDNGMVVKLKATTSGQLMTLKDTWELHKKHFKLGYKLKYSIPESIIEQLEQDIVIDDKVYKPTLIMSEDQFKIEGMIMKNCMAKQFNVGNLYIHVAMSLGRKRVNLQYRKGVLNQAKGKTNTNVPKDFEKAVELFGERMINYSDVHPIKEKYDIISGSESNG